MPCARRKRPIALICGWHPIPAHACSHPRSDLYQNARPRVPWPEDAACARPACDIPSASPGHSRATLGRLVNNFDTCRTDRETMLIVLLWSVSTRSLMVSRDWSIEHLPTHTPCCRCSADGGELAVSARRQRYIAPVQPTRESSFVFRRLFLPARPHPLLFVCVCC